MTVSVKNKISIKGNLTLSVATDDSIVIDQVYAEDTVGNDLISSYEPYTSGQEIDLTPSAGEGVNEIFFLNDTTIGQYGQAFGISKAESSVDGGSWIDRTSTTDMGGSFYWYEGAWYNASNDGTSEIILAPSSWLGVQGTNFTTVSFRFTFNHTDNAAGGD